MDELLAPPIAPTRRHGAVALIITAHNEFRPLFELRLSPKAFADLDYYVIDSAGQTVVIDEKLADQVEREICVPFNLLMRYSVHIWEHSLDILRFSSATASTIS